MLIADKTDSLTLVEAAIVELGQAKVVNLNNFMVWQDIRSCSSVFCMIMRQTMGLGAVLQLLYVINVNLYTCIAWIKAEYRCIQIDITFVLYLIWDSINIYKGHYDTDCEWPKSWRIGQLDQNRTAWTVYIVYITCTLHLCTVAAIMQKLFPKLA